MNWITPLIDDYHKWLRSKTFVTTDEQTGWSSISTPFMGLFNDIIEIYAQKQQDGRIILSDNGETLNNLELVGAKLRGEKRKDIADKIFLNYGITLKDNELLVETNEQGFSQKKHNFISAMIELNDISMVSTHNVATIFKDDVSAYLNEKEIIYTPDFISKGSTGLEFTFDFQIAHKDREIVLKSFNSVNKLNLPSFLFAWEDIKPVREKATKKEVKAIAVINDIDKEIKDEYLDALNSKNADYFLWSKRNEAETMGKLAAA